MSGLCYVVPKYDADSEEHFFHIYSLLSELGKRVPLAVIAERAKGKVEFPTAKFVYGQRFTAPPLRWVELFLVLLYARFRGFSRLYVHYSYWACLLGFFTHRLTGGRVYYWNCGHASWFFQPWSWSKASLFDHLAIQWPLKLSIALSSFLVTGTKRMADYYNLEFGKKLSRILVVPNEVDLRRYAGVKPAKLDVPKGARTVLFVHRLSPRKGAHLLPDIIRETLAIEPSAFFIIAGDGPSRPGIEKRVREYGLLERVQFLGWVANRDVPPLMAACDAYIMPSQEEGFPRVLIEAMAAGIPFVASDVGGVRDITTKEQQEFLVAKQGGDVPVKEFTEALVSLLKDEKKRAALSKQGMEWVRQYDLSQVVNEYASKVAGPWRR